MDLRVVIAGGDKAAGHARRVLAERLSAALPAHVLGDLQLLVTEIVANSVRHGGVGEDGEIDLRVAISDHRVRVEMRDTGIQADPQLRTPDLGGGGGFGMVTQVLVVAVQNAVERTRLGTATAATGFFRALGGAAGAAALGAVFAAHDHDVADGVRIVFLCAAPLAGLALLVVLRLQEVRLLSKVA